MTKAAATSTPFFEIPNLVIGELLGRGAQSIVYKAMKGSIPYAVKIPKENIASKSLETRLAFQREAAILARLKHPNLPEVLAVDEIDGLPYVVMEYIEGRTLADLITQGALPEQEIWRIAKAIAGALHVAHQQGLVHRDIKPQNILISDSGIPKLIDFGLATEQREKSESELAIGTFLYSSPEQTGMLKRPVDGRADLYSLGVVLFECATGSPPFNAADAGLLIRRHATEMPPKASSINSALSPLLDLVLTKLLAKDPDDRYQTGLGFIQDIEMRQDLSRQLSLGQTPGLGTRDDPALAAMDFPLVGREIELQALQEKWNEVRRKVGCIALVEGEPGSGKSRLIRELLSKLKPDEQNAHRLLILRGKCNSGDPAPFSPLRDAMDDYLRRIQTFPQVLKDECEAQIQSAVGTYAPLLKRISPRLAVLLERNGPLRDVMEAQDLFYNAVASFFKRLASQYDAVFFFLDDIQWLDEGSKEILFRLASQMGAVPMMIVCAARSDEESRLKVDAICQHFGDKLSLRLALKQLDEVSVEKLISVHLAGAKASTGFSRQIFNRSQGSPFAVGEYLRAMLSSGYLRPYWGEWKVEADQLDKLDLPSDVIYLVIRRTNDLPAATRRILQIAAVAGSPFPLESIRRVAGTSAGEINSAIAEGIKNHLVERDEGGNYRFVHDRLREAMISGICSDELRKTHQLLADALDASQNDTSDAIFARAQHLQLGEIENSPRRVLEATYKAGVKALELFAIEEAYQFLKSNLILSETYGLDLDPGFNEVLARTCEYSGRTEEAIVYLRKTLQHQKDPLDRAAIRGRISRILVASLFFSKLAGDELDQAFAELGRRAPSSGSFNQWLQMFIGWSLGYLMHYTKIGYGSAKGRKRKEFMVRAQLAEHAAMVNFFLNRNGALVQSTFGHWNICYQLGSELELAHFYLAVATVFGMFRFQKLSDYYSNCSRRVTELLGNPIATAREQAYEALRIFFCGQIRESQMKGLRCFQEFGDWMPTEDAINLGCTLVWGLVNRGYAQEALQLSVRISTQVNSFAQREKEGASKYKSSIAIPISSYTMSAYASLGMKNEALEQYNRFQSLGCEDPFILSVFYGNLLAFHLEQGELGLPVEDCISQFNKLGYQPGSAALSSRHFYLNAAIARLLQYEAATQEEKPQRLQVFKTALADFKKTAHDAVLQAHFKRLQASMLRIEGRYEESFKALSLAERHADEIDSPLIRFDIAREKAILFRLQNNPQASQFEYRLALSICQAQGWLPREKRLRKLFDSATHSSNLHSQNNSISVTHGSNVGNVIQFTENVTLRRQLDALLQLSKSASQSHNLAQQEVVVLDEIVRILRAERAFLFLAEPGTKLLKMKTGRDSSGITLNELKGYSTTVINQVAETLKALVISGTEEGAVLGSQSTVAFGLRSIMAAPLMLQDQFMGVVYLDNRIVKGIFTEDDVLILQALANHIAIALENARTSQVEKEKEALKKDLELAGAVQTLLLPKQNSFENPSIKMRAHYQPSNQAGGDWWWFDQREDGSILFILGDVTGHGAGSAMVTAAIAGSFQTLKTTLTEIRDLPSALKTLHQTLLRLAGGKYHMTLSALEVNPFSGKMQYWSCGAPPIFTMSESGEVITLVGGSNPIGSTEFQMAERSLLIQAPHRILLFTDGAYDFKMRNGNPYSLLRLRKLFHSTKAMDLPAGHASIIEELSSNRLDNHFEDDMTVLCIDISPADSAKSEP